MTIQRLLSLSLLFCKLGVSADLNYGDSSVGYVNFTGWNTKYISPVDSGGLTVATSDGGAEFVSGNDGIAYFD